MPNEPKAKKSSAKEPAERVFTPTPEAKASATQKRLFALLLWAVAIALELVAIFWVLRPPFDEMVESQGFPDSRWYMLIGFLVVIGALAIGGSFLWKKANRLDPASRAQPVRFFIQNQLGAIIAIAAFLPLIILIFKNDDMNAKQKNVAGGVGAVIAAAAVIFGIDFQPLSQEQAYVESQVVTQLVGEDRVWWAAGGDVMHLCEEVSDLQRSSDVASGTVAEAFAAGKEGITLNVVSNLEQCGLAIPENIEEIVEWVRSSRGR